jgi:hypothetical protein
MLEVEVQHRQHAGLDHDNLSAAIEVGLQHLGHSSGLQSRGVDHALRHGRASVRNAGAQRHVNAYRAQQAYRRHAALRRAIVGEGVGQHDDGRLDRAWLYPALLAEQLLPGLGWERR